MNASANLLQVPIVTAFIWFYLSRTNATLGALNKAILAAELAPEIGDIQFPEGVLLGAAMESWEDVLKILDKAGVLDTITEGLSTVGEKIKNESIEKAQDSGDFLGDQIIRIIPDRTCEYWTSDLKKDWDLAKSNPIKNWEASARFWIALKKMKKQGCDRPDWISTKNWDML